MVMTQATTLKRTKIQESMFAILGYCADDETVEVVADDWADYDEDNYGYYEYDENDADWKDDEFDYDVAYYEDDISGADPVRDYEFDIADYDFCYTLFLDTRKKLNDLRMIRGFFPVVALDLTAFFTSTLLI